uniref:Uncharacterized protein n=1 Tax=Anguilla anguilla TaxID=7936 RepID=A0A0E9PHZ4_ANGAN
MALCYGISIGAFKLQTITGTSIYKYAAIGEIFLIG